MQTLHSQAEQFIKKNNIEKILSLWSEWFFAGSFKSDLMIDKDIDIIMKIKGRKLIDYFEFGKILLEKLNPIQLKLENIEKGIKEFLPFVYYLGIRTLDGWKMDIRALEDKVFIKMKNYDELFRSKLTKEKRKIIINLKKLYKLPDGHYKNKVTSWNIYCACLNDNVKNEKEFEKWLLKNQFKKINLKP